ncbi:uncharacterized protein UTRI_04549_B [Ustilago trichophora]|uniref:Effector family protein Eff1 n=1 Tax=Ustilago trichophora TaxID=86804 RepID=A0A5C3EBY5_9BASI|nr:uncharacterized protein UTRI_04549_B [Ustilago trichophora]
MIPLSSSKQRRKRQAWITLLLLFLLFNVALAANRRSGSLRANGSRQAQQFWKRSGPDSASEVARGASQAPGPSKESAANLRRTISSPELSSPAVEVGGGTSGAPNLGKDSAVGLRRTFSSLGISTPQSPPIFETARTSRVSSPARSDTGSERSHGSDSIRSEFGSEKSHGSDSIRSEDKFGPLEYSSTSDGDTSARSQGSHITDGEIGGKLKDAELRRIIQMSNGRLQYTPQSKKLEVQLRPTDRLRYDPLEEQHLMDDPEAELRAKLARGPRWTDLPPPVLAERLPDGTIDYELQSGANKRIREKVLTLPVGDPRYFQHVVVADDGAPGGYRVFRYSHQKDGSVFRQTENHIPDILHDLMLYEDHLKETEREELAKSTIKSHGWDSLRPVVRAGEDDWSRAVKGVTAAPPKDAWGRAMDKYKGKVADARWKLQTKMSDLKDVIAVGRDRSLEKYHTTGGIPALYGRQMITNGMVIPAEARSIAQQRGEARIFYSPFDEKSQIRITYDGQLKKPTDELLPPSHFRTYLVKDPKLALPLPRHWREKKKPEGNQETTDTRVDVMEDSRDEAIRRRRPRMIEYLRWVRDFDDKREWAPRVPLRWPTTKWDPAKARMKQEVQKFGQRVNSGWNDVNTGLNNAWQKARGISGPRSWFTPRTSPGGEATAGSEGATAAEGVTQASGLGARINAGWNNAWSRVQAVGGPRTWFNSQRRPTTSTGEASPSSTSIEDGEATTATEGGEAAAERAAEETTQAASQAPNSIQRLNNGLSTAWKQAKTVGTKAKNVMTDVLTTPFIPSVRRVMRPLPR